MNLILIAGDKCLRDQHFREKIGIGHKSCDFQDEGDLSVYSKRVLKEWFTDKLKTDDIEYRVPIDNVEETKRKPEFTVLSRKSKLAIRYWRHRANICEDKVDVLLDNTRIKTILVTDISNGGCEGQYPEALMKLQERQNYCLLLVNDSYLYSRAELKVVFYEKNLDGLWTENIVCKGYLKNYNISENREIVYEGIILDYLVESAKKLFMILLRLKSKKDSYKNKKRLIKKKSTKKKWSVNVLSGKRGVQRMKKYAEKRK